MRFYQDNGLCVAKIDFAFKHIPQKYGLRWTPELKAYTTTDVERFKEMVDAMKATAPVATGKEKRRLEMSRAQDADIDFPVPSGLSYLPYQRAGIAYALEGDGALIGDEMGLGKTIQGIGIANAVKARSILIVCPSSLKWNWKKELDKWLVTKLDTHIATSKSFPSFANVIIINYDILHKYKEQLRRVEWDLLICDESHNLKNPSARRSRQIYGYYAGTNRKDAVEPIAAKKRIFLSGTPIMNAPHEIWPQVSFLNPDYWVKPYKDKHHAKAVFEAVYCKKEKSRFAPQGKISGANMNKMNELQRRLRESCMIRRLKSEVLKDLPPKQRQVIEFEGNKETQQAIQAEAIGMADLKHSIGSIRTAISKAEKTGDMEAYERQVTQLKAGWSAMLSEISKLRKQTAVAKAPLMVEYLKEVLQSTDKVIVFAHHRDVMDIIKQAFPKEAVMVRGGMTDVKKDEAVERFQDDPSIKLFIGSIKAAGVGLTLTAASTVIFAELDWVPANMLQAEDRAHRYGQKADSVLIQHFVLAESLDANMARKIVQKQNMCDRALDDELDHIIKLPVIPE